MNISYRQFLNIPLKRKISQCKFTIALLVLLMASYLNCFLISIYVEVLPLRIWPHMEIGSLLKKSILSDVIRMNPNLICLYKKVKLRHKCINTEEKKDVKTQGEASHLQKERCLEQILLS